MLVAVIHQGVMTIEPTHPIAGYAITWAQGLSFSALFLFAGWLFGRTTCRKIPLWCNYKYEPGQAWPLLFILTLFIIENYVARVIESYVIYGEMMREGIWVFAWGVLCAYGVAVGYSGKFSGFKS